MHLDIVCSLVIYTMATVAFYLLGAGVLHRLGLVPAERDTITVLSNIYTQTLGGWTLWLFYLGAVVTLYGTVFASTAAHARLFADAMRVAGVYAREDGAARIRWRNRFVIILSVIPVTVLLVPALAGADGRRRRHRPGPDAAAHRRGSDLPAPHPAAARHPAIVCHDGAALDLERSDARVRGVLRVGAVETRSLSRSFGFGLSGRGSVCSATQPFGFALRSSAVSIARIEANSEEYALLALRK